MKGEWVDVAIGDIAEIVGGSTPSTADKSNFDGDIPWLTPKDLSEPHSRYVSHGERSLSAKGLTSCSARLLPRNSVLLSSRAPIGYVAIAANQIATNQGFRSLVLGPGNDHEFLYYWLTANVEELERHASGSTFKELSGGSLKKIHIRIPSDVTEQRAIAHILGTLDDKIELNRQMKKTLEAIARALFKSWFVDFDPVRAKAEGRDPGLPKEIADLFPDSFEDSELGEIPKGWSVGTIGSVADVIDCLHSKKPERHEYGLPLLQLSNIRDDGLIDMQDTYFIEEADYRKWISRMEASPSDCVITNVGRVGAVAQMPVGQKAALGRNMTGVRCKSGFPYPTVLIECLLSKAMKDEIVLKKDTGTILDALNVRNIPKLRFVLGEREVLRYFEHQARPIRAQMETHLAYSRTLSALRDTLLPKLVSGELRVKDAERYLEGVGV